MQKEGSVSIFLAMVFISLSSLFLCMAEGVRYLAMAKSSKIYANETKGYLESLYHEKLWDEYGITAIDESFSGKKPFYDRTKDFVSSEFISDDERMNYFICDINSLTISDKKYLIDDGGEAFFRLAVKKELERLPRNAFQKIESQVKSGTVDLDEEDEFDKRISDGEKAIEDSKEQENKEIEENKYEKKDWSGVDNPMDLAKEKRGREDMSFWIGDKGVSINELMNDNLPSSNPISKSGFNNPVSKLIYSQYLKDYFGNFLNQSKNGCLCYGTEYVICGKKSDKENLEAIIRRLLVLREVQNTISIKTNAALDMEAGSLALSLAGFTANPMIIESVKLGIIAGWAYVESVLDVRTLLMGERVPALKTVDQFTSSLPTLASCLDKSIRAKSVKNGISYEMYLSAILLVEKQEKVNFRTMDLIEETIKKDSMYEKFSMKNLIYKCDVGAEITGKPVLLGFVDLKHKPTKYNFMEKIELNYLN